VDACECSRLISELVLHVIKRCAIDGFSSVIAVISAFPRERRNLSPARCPLKQVLKLLTLTLLAHYFHTNETVLHPAS